MEIPFRYALLLLSFAAVSSAYNYCDLHVNHTMCLTTGVGSACEGTLKKQVPNQAAKEDILAWHNNYRRRAALGEENLAKGGPLDSAANMMKMMWDTELATYAQRLAEQCVGKHDHNRGRKVKNGRFMVGQNIARKSGDAELFPSTIDWVERMDSWYTKEVLVFNTSYVDDFVFGEGEWGHYSQVIWWNTRSIGCGGSIYVKGGDTFHLMVCNYGAAGNIDGYITYKAGDNCSDCPANYDTCDAGLCALSDVTTFDVEESMGTDYQYIKGKKMQKS